MFPPDAVRVDELVDTLEICVRMWTEERATYAGKRYSVTDAPCAPKPVQSPLPIWVGGTKPRVMRIAARYATWVHYNAGDRTPDGIGARDAALDAACRAVKRDTKTLRRSTFLSIFTGATPREVDALVADEARGAKQTPDEWRAARPAAIVGTPKDVLARLKGYADIGIAHVNAVFPYRHEIEMVELLGPVVVPALA